MAFEGSREIVCLEISCLDVTRGGVSIVFDDIGMTGID